MITYFVSEIFSSPAKVLVNTVNTVGVMGKGIAKEFKYFYPEMFVEYQRLCERNQFNIGQLWLYKTPGKWVLNFPTKKHWRHPSRPEYLESGLQRFVETYAENGITSVSFPLLGCGNGELSWKDTVRPLMEKYLKNLPIEIFIHISGRDPFVPEHRDPIAMRLWLRSEPESLAFNEVWDELCEIFSEPKQLQTYDKELFTASIVERPYVGIEVNASNKPFMIHKDALLDLWQSIRTMGFCMDTTMPSGLDHYAPYVIALLASLSYLKLIMLRTQAGRTVGLRVQIPPRRHTNNILTPVKMTEPV